MAKQKLEIYFKRRWWFRYLYIPGLRVTAWSLAYIGVKAELNEKKAAYWLRKGLVACDKHGKPLKGVKG